VQSGCRAGFGDSIRPIATGIDPFDGKEGVNGSSPLEGFGETGAFAGIPARPAPAATKERSSCRFRGSGDTVW
jgi:hypothetical protein